MQLAKRRIAVAILAGKLVSSLIVILAVSNLKSSGCQTDVTSGAAAAPAPAKKIDLSLIVPTTYVDFLCYKQRFFTHLYNSVVDPPQEIIFVISSVPAEISKIDFPQPPPQLNEDSSINIQIVIFYAAHNAAQNRNIGAALSIGEFVTFFDMDDVLHRQRFEVIRFLAAQEYPSIDAALFGYKKGTHAESEAWLQDAEEIKLEYLAPPFKPEYLHYAYHQIVEENPAVPLSKFWCCKDVGITTVANGWGTYRRNIFLKYQYNESLNKGEDSDLNIRLILGGEKFSLWEDALGFYESNAGREDLCGIDDGALH